MALLVSNDVVLGFEANASPRALDKQGLDFVTSNLLDVDEGFRRMQVTAEAGVKFPYYFRHMSGITEAFAIFTYPSGQYPDISQFLEVIPDMAHWINIHNDVLS